MVAATLDHNSVTRTSDTVVTITLPALGSYSTVAPETILLNASTSWVGSGGMAVIQDNAFVIHTVAGTAALSGGTVPLITLLTPRC